MPRAMLFSARSWNGPETWMRQIRSVCRNWLTTGRSMSWGKVVMRAIADCTSASDFDMSTFSLNSSVISPRPS